MQGIYVRGEHPASKGELRRAIRDRPDEVRLVATSVFGGEHDGPIGTMPLGHIAYVAGPDPLSAPTWRAKICRLRAGGFEVR